MDSSTTRTAPEVNGPTQTVVMVWLWYFVNGEGSFVRPEVPKPDDPILVGGDFQGHPGVKEGEEGRSSPICFVSSVKPILFKTGTGRVYRLMGSPSEAYVAWLAQKGYMMDPKNPFGVEITEV